MARGAGERCNMGHHSTSIHRLRGLRRPPASVSCPSRERGQPPRPHTDDHERRPGEPLPRQPTHRARDTTEFESDNDRRAAARRQGRQSSVRLPGILQPGSGSNRGIAAGPCDRSGSVSPPWFATSPGDARHASPRSWLKVRGDQDRSTDRYRLSRGVSLVAAATGAAAFTVAHDTQRSQAAARSPRGRQMRGAVGRL